MHWNAPDPPLAATEFTLRPFRIGDAAEVASACTDPKILRFTFMREGLTVDDAEQWIERGNELWPHGNPRFAIADAGDDRLLGQIGMAVDDHSRAEAYYWIAPGARRRGMASGALGLLADWAFDNGVERLYLLIHPRTRRRMRWLDASASLVKGSCAPTSRSRGRGRIS